MKIVLVSDSHGNDVALDEIAMLHKDADIFLHAGDSEEDEYMITPFETVRGNCDHFSNAPERKIIDTPIGKLLMQHYPTIPYDIIEKYHIKFFIHGHTHMRKHEQIKDLIIINPGSLSFARDQYDLSYAILQIDEHHYNLTFHSLLDEK